MNKKAIAAISGATLLALTTTASAGSVSETSSTAIMPPKHHSYVWRHGWRYGWYPQYAWYGDKYYAWNPVRRRRGPLWVWLRFHLHWQLAACPITTILTMDIRIIISKFGCGHDRNLPDGAKIVASRSQRFWIART